MTIREQAKGMGFRLDRGSRVSFAAQVQRQAVAQFVAGRLQAGDRLPSVRQLARDLRVSRTTAERIHEALNAAMVLKVRPRSGVYFEAPALPDPSGSQDLRWARTFERLVLDTLARAQELGVTPSQLARVLGRLGREDAASQPPPVVLPLVATRDAFECMRQSLPPDFPVRLVHVPPGASQPRLSERPRYVLCGYYLRDRALRIAEGLGATVVYVRYNTRRLDEMLAIPAGRHRFIVTRDADNTETTRVFLASAYPEVPMSSYTVLPVAQCPAVLPPEADVWAYATAAPEVITRTGHIPQLYHPVLADDFIDELRCLAMFAMLR